MPSVQKVETTRALQEPGASQVKRTLHVLGVAAVVMVHTLTVLLFLACLLRSSKSVELLQTGPQHIYDNLSQGQSARLLLPYKGLQPAAVTAAPVADTGDSEWPYCYASDASVADANAADDDNASVPRWAMSDDNTGLEAFSEPLVRSVFSLNLE